MSYREYFSISVIVDSAMEESVVVTKHFGLSSVVEEGVFSVFIAVGSTEEQMCFIADLLTYDIGNGE